MNFGFMKGYSMDYKIIDIKTINTKNEGSLSFFQLHDDIDFDIKRIYYIYNADSGVLRGKHAHKELKQILFCPYGSVQIKLDDGQRSETVSLSQPHIGLIIGPSTWREMVWEIKDSVLCVAASMKFDESDYIRNYNDFLKYVRGE